MVGQVLLICGWELVFKGRGLVKIIILDKQHQQTVDSEFKKKEKATIEPKKLERNSFLIVEHKYLSC